MNYLYDKMALVVLAKYSNSGENIDRDLLISKMGVKNVEFGSEYSDIAIKKLIKKGLLMRQLTICKVWNLENLMSLMNFESLDDLEELKEKNGHRIILQTHKVIVLMKMV